MEAIESKIHTQDAEFLSNQSNMRSLVAELTDNLTKIREREDTDSVKLHRSRGS